MQLWKNLYQDIELQIFLDNDEYLKEWLSINSIY